jgi:hypothetical protein
MDTPEDKQAKIEAMRADISITCPQLLERFNEIHPLPTPGPSTLVEALTQVRSQATVDTAQAHGVGPWYGLRCKFGMGCSMEHRLAAHMHHFM